MKKTFSTLAFAIFAAPSFAQMNFSVSLPQNFNLVEITADGVNLRKAPNATSPKLVVKMIDDCYDCEPDYVWQNERPAYRKLEAAHPGGIYVKKGVSGEWTNISYGGENVFFMSKFCTDVTLRDATSKELEKWQIEAIPGCPGYYIMQDPGGMETPAALWLGKKEGKVLVFDRNLPAPMFDEESKYALRTEKNEDSFYGYELYFGKYLCTPKVLLDDNGERLLETDYYFNVSKLTKEHINFLLKNAKKAETPAYFVAPVGGKAQQI